MRTPFVALFTLLSSAALAQSPEPAPETATPPSEATAPASEATSPSVDERVTTTEGKVASLEEQNLETKTDLSALKKLKFSGYVQGRYQYQQALDDTGVGGFSRFTVRRGRLKGTYTGDIAQFVLQLDAVPTGVTLKDAEATLFIPGTKQNLSLTLGQTKWPFGYEGPQSSSDREFPERTRVVGAFLAGERDRGLKFSGKWGALRLSAGVFDGNGTSNTGFVGTDNDKEKDLVGRLGFDLKWISGGVSGWYGHTLGKRATDAFRVAHRRSRFGADVQMYLDVVPLGGTALKAEYLTGTSYLRGGVEQFGVPASGWYALLVQNIGLSHALALRYDYFDPENGLPDAASATDATRPASNNATGTLGIAAIHYLGEHLKVTAAYELPMTATAGEAQDPKDNLFTLQLQARF
jgi:phosphate-selective porin